MEYVISNSPDPPKLRALLLGSLSLITLSLSVFGIYGVISSFVGNADPRDQYSNGLGCYATQRTYAICSKGRADDDHWPLCWYDSVFFP